MIDGLLRQQDPHFTLPFTRAGRDRQARQLYRCGVCGRRLTTRSASAFSGYRFPDDIIALAVRWHLRFRLPYADLA